MAYHLKFLLFFLMLVCTSSQGDDVYIIHMDTTKMPKAYSTHHHWYISNLKSISPTSTHIYSYNRVFQGFSALLSLSELHSLEASPGFIYAMRDKPGKLHTTHSSKFLGLSPGSGAWATTELGRGVIIGVVDTGVWPESKSFNDQGMSVIPSKWKGECEAGTQFNASLCNKKLIGARTFSKGFVAHHPNITIPMNSTRDTQGHGTHTSSTAAGNFVEDASFFGYASGTMRGMAPRAHLAMYKVGFGEDGDVYRSDVIAAIDKAVEDGVDVISLSLGFDHEPLYEDPVAVAAFGAVNEGVFVSASAGNSGVLNSQVDNGAPWVLTVAAGSMDREFRVKLHLENGVSFTGNCLNLIAYPYTWKYISIVHVGSCSNLKFSNTAGVTKIVVCEVPSERYGEQGFDFDDINIAGAVFIFNSSYTIEFEMVYPFPVIFLGTREGSRLSKFIKDSKTELKAKMELNITVLGAKPAPRVASFSSRGPSRSCPHLLKPDVTAPGETILAAWPDNVAVDYDPSSNSFSSFNVLSGTSMACPHAAGVAALVRAAHPHWSPAAVRSAIMTSADVTDNTHLPITDYDSLPATPLAMGAGHINPNRALNPGIVYDATTQDYIDLLCAMDLTSRQIHAITGSSSWNCSSPSLDLNYPSFIAFFGGNSTTVKVFKRTVTYVGDGPAEFAAKIKPIRGFKIVVFPEAMEFKAMNETGSFQVRIEGPSLTEEDTLFGYLIWEDDGGKFFVRSPIVVTGITPAF